MKTARKFYDEKLKEDSSLGTIELMELYAKHLIESNFCDGSACDFEKCSVEELKLMHDRIDKLINWTYE